MNGSGISGALVEFMRAHEMWTLPLVFGLAFCESFAFISLIVPATAILLAAGGLIGASRVSFAGVWAAACAGAFVGDWIAYELALRFEERITHIWPLSRHPDLIAHGRRFFERWGALSVFVGRFFGPLRAVVPIVAGVCGMGRIAFQAANLASAMLWAVGILGPGFFGVRWFLLD
jgi:membrane protein DedA with SNARE-associated domain